MIYDPIHDEWFRDSELADRVAEYQEAYFDALDRGETDEASVYEAALGVLEAESAAEFADYEDYADDEDDDDEPDESDDAYDYGELDDYLGEAEDLAEWFDWDIDDLDDPYEFDISFEYEET